MNLAEVEFELEWTKKKLDGCIQSVTNLIHENDQLRGILESLFDRYHNYTLGDLWTQEDMIVMKDALSAFEELE